MQTRHLTRRVRQVRVRETLEEDPFLTDEELAQRFDVSVQTIRLDRMALGIPELRQRTRAMAQRFYGRVKSIGMGELVGELIDLRLGESGLSLLETTEDMVFEKTRIVRSHFIFAQADSLALAIIDAHIAVTGLVNAKYRRPVMAGERLLADARVIRVRGDDKFVVQVITRSGGEQVFRAKFVVFALHREPGQGADA